MKHEKRPKYNYHLDIGFTLTEFTSFGECLFLQGVIRKDPKEVYMSDLHRDKKATYTEEESRRHQNALDRRRGPPITRAG
jgi:hypothetical protein